MLSQNKIKEFELGSILNPPPPPPTNLNQIFSPCKKALKPQKKTKKNITRNQYSTEYKLQEQPLSRAKSERDNNTNIHMPKAHKCFCFCINQTEITPKKQTLAWTGPISEKAYTKKRAFSSYGVLDRAPPPPLKERKKEKGNTF